MKDAWYAAPSPRFYRCPACDREVFEAVYLDGLGQIRGCDRCLRQRPVELVLAGEAM